MKKKVLLVDDEKSFTNLLKLNLEQTGRYDVRVVNWAEDAMPAAREFAQFGIRVMTIAPGIFFTPMLAALPEEAQKSLGSSVPFPPRLGQPEEYADLALFIIRNGYMNGETIRIDGALRMAPR